MIQFLCSIKLKVFPVFLISVLFLLLFANFVHAEESNRIVRVGVYDNSPKIYKDENGEIRGLFADIVNAVGQRENWKIEYVYGTWKEGLSRLENGEIDVMVDVAISPARRDIYDFTEETVLVNWGIVYSREGLNINGLEDFEDKKIAIMKTGIHYGGPLGIKNILETFEISAEYIDVEVYSDVFELLDKKKADIGIVNRFFGIDNEPNYDVVRSSVIFNPSELRFAFTKDNPDNDILINAFDSTINEIKKDPESFYYEFIKEHLLSYLVRVENKIPQWVGVVLSILTLIIFLSISLVMVSNRYQMILARRVDEKTAELEKSIGKYQRLYKKSQEEVAEMEILTKAAVNRELRIKELKDKLGNVKS